MRRIVIPLLALLLAVGTTSTASAGGPAYESVADDPPMLAATPPLGWNSWNTFGCDINEKLIRDTADLMVSSGMAAAGYEYVNVDDCWAEHDRDPASGRYVAHHERFPSGIKALADYIHGKGLKLGIYTSAGTMTCAQTMPGSLGHEVLDAQTFAEWGVDYLKYDNCNNEGVPAQERYKAMGDALKATGRPIVYSICEWGQNQPWLWGSSVGGNLWRTTGDITDTFSSVVGILDQQVGLEAYSKPGAWNDPDMLEVGNPGLTRGESRAHMSLWSLLNAPLIAGNDLRVMTGWIRGMLTDPDVLAVNQDWAGRQGAKIRDDGDREVWAKKLSDGSAAVVLLNRGSTGATISTTVQQLGLPASPNGYTVKNVWTDGLRSSGGTVRAQVPSHDAAMYVVKPGGTANLAPLVTVEAVPDSPFAESGQAVTAKTRIYNDGTTAVTQARLGLTVPDGWTATPRSSTQLPAVPPGQAGAVRWELTAEAPELGPVDLVADGNWSWHDVVYTASGAGRFTVVSAPPSGSVELSSLPWLFAENGWGPVERDTSVGEADPGDGHPITIAGTVYPKGLGAHAPGAVGFYLGGHCSRFTVTAGIDDEVGDRGHVLFSVVGDGVQLASAEAGGSGGAVSLEVAVTGVDQLELRLDTTADGPNYDHADWAQPVLTCT